MTDYELHTYRFIQSHSPITSAGNIKYTPHNVTPDYIREPSANRNPRRSAVAQVRIKCFLPPRIGGQPAVRLNPPNCPWIQRQAAAMHPARIGCVNRRLGQPPPEIPRLIHRKRNPALRKTGTALALPNHARAYGWIRFLARSPALCAEPSGRRHRGIADEEIEFARC